MRWKKRKRTEEKRSVSAAPAFAQSPAFPVQYNKMQACTPIKSANPAPTPTGVRMRKEVDVGSMHIQYTESPTHTRPKPTAYWWCQIHNKQWIGSLKLSKNQNAGSLLATGGAKH